MRSSPLDVREQLRIGERVRVRELGLASAAAHCPRSRRSVTPTRRHSGPRTWARRLLGGVDEPAAVVTRRRTPPTESSGSRPAAADRSAGVHARPHQSRTRSASTWAVCTTDGTNTRSSTPWMRSACGPMQTAGTPEAMKARASVVAVVGPVRPVSRRPLPRPARRLHDRLVVGDERALAGEPVVAHEQVLGEIRARRGRALNGVLDQPPKLGDGCPGIVRDTIRECRTRRHGRRPAAPRGHRR